jgi:iron complex transport system ATP-binding protein
MVGVQTIGDTAGGITLETRSVSLSYEDNEVIHDLSLAIRPRQITALVGPNGSGKSTLLKGLARLMRPSAGAVYLDSQEIHRLPTKQVARRLAMLPQRPEAPDGLTVRELAAFGRFPHQGFFGALTREDDEKIDHALELAGISALAFCALGELSGGQRQLAWIAMALAQDAQLLLLDEPTTFLDMSHQIEVLDVLRRLNREHGHTIVMVLHDLNMAARYAAHMVVLGEGKLLAQGPPSNIMRPDLLAAAFGINATILTDPRSGAIVCIPYSPETPRTPLPHPVTA